MLHVTQLNGFSSRQFLDSPGTYPTWDPASPFLNSWVLSNDNLTASLGNTSPPQTVRGTVPVKGVSSGMIRAMEYKFDSIGPMTGTKVYALGFLQDSTSSVLSSIGYQFYNGAAILDIAAASLQSGVRVLLGVPVPVVNDVLGFTFDMSATNIVMRLYRNGVALAGPYTLSAAFNGVGSNVGLTLAGSNVGGLGTNAVTASIRCRVSQMQYFASYGATTGFWV